MLNGYVSLICMLIYRNIVGTDMVIIVYEDGGTFIIRFIFLRISNLWKRLGLLLGIYLLLCLNVNKVKDLIWWYDVCYYCF